MRLVSCALVALAAAGAVQAEEIDWRPDLEAGLREARQSGRAVFVVTRWKDGV